MPKLLTQHAITHRSRLAIIATVLLASPSAHSNIGLDYGFGAHTSALAGAGAAYGFGAFAAYHNPAGLAFDGGEKRLLVDIGLIGMNPSFLPISNVLIENSYISDKPTYGDVDNNYRATAGEQIGLVYRVLPDTYNLSVGVTVFMPLQQIAYMDTGDTFVPEYTLYRSRTQRPQVELGVGMDLGHGLKFGVGTHLAFALTSNANTYLQTDTTKPSSMRLTASLKPKLAGQFGLLFTPQGSPLPLTLGWVLRTPVSSPSEVYLKAATRAFKTAAAFDFNFKAQSALFYDPWTSELGGTIAETTWMRTVLQVDYQAWSHFQSPALVLDKPEGSIDLSGSIGPTFEYQDIVVPRVAQEFTLNDRVTLRFGYAYRPSIYKNLPTGAGNALDPAKHILTTGVGIQFEHFLNFNTPCTIDASFQWHQFVTQHIVKTPGDETGSTAGDPKIGAPGYDAGGKIYGGGVDLSLAF